MTAFTSIASAEVAFEQEKVPSSLKLKVILTAFTIALVLALGTVTFALVSRIFARLAPAIRQDLGWKAQREAEELAQTCELSIVMRDQDTLAKQLRSSAEVPDVLAAVIVDSADRVLATNGPVPNGEPLFGSAERTVTELPGAVSAWAGTRIESQVVGKIAVIVSTERLKQIEQLRIAVLTMVVIACLAAAGLSAFFVGAYLGPLISLTERALARLTDLTQDLERRVQTRTRELSETNGRLEESLKRIQDAQRQKEESRKAGMADVATAVLHNVGNVLNNVNIASGVMAETLKRSHAAGVGKLAQLLAQPELTQVLSAHPKAQKIPAYVNELSTALETERDDLQRELAGLQRNVEHIKVIVAMQQAHAKTAGGVLEPVSLKEIVEDALTMNSLSNDAHHIRIVRVFEDVPVTLVDRHKVFQIIMNLLSNARHAIMEAGRGGDVSLRLRQSPGALELEIADTGCGIPEANMPKIFNHGFTTKRDGHGFGLHSAACAATELGGTLSCKSQGVGQGAAFTLRLPAKAIEGAA